MIAIERRPSGEWKVVTDKGDIVCEHVVSATGNFARQTGRMVGINVPVIPVQHQYIVTEAHPEISGAQGQGPAGDGGAARIGFVLVHARGGGRPPARALRERRAGLLCRRAVGGQRIRAVSRKTSTASRLTSRPRSRAFPPSARSGVKKVYNGAIAYTPDGSPIVGPAPGLKNFWLNEGHSFGVTAAGGAGWQLAEWIVDGEPTIDMLGVDPRRFGPYARDRAISIEKNEEAYAKVFTVHYPDEERVAARPLRQTPCYDRG